MKFLGFKRIWAKDSLTSLIPEAFQKPYKMAACYLVPVLLIYMTPQPERKPPPFRSCWGVQRSTQCLAVSNMSMHRGTPGSTLVDYLLITSGTEQFLICSVVTMKFLVLVIAVSNSNLV